MDSGHFEIVRESLTGDRAVDEKTFASLAVLSERLEHLKRTDKTFEGVEFSAAVRQISKRSNVAAVC